MAIWAVVKQQVEHSRPPYTPNGLPPGGAGGGSSWNYEVIDTMELIAARPKLLVREPSWIVCGEFVQQCWVFEPVG